MAEGVFLTSSFIPEQALRHSNDRSGASPNHSRRSGLFTRLFVLTILVYWIRVDSLFALYLVFVSAPILIFGGDEACSGAPCECAMQYKDFAPAWAGLELATALLAHYTLSKLEPGTDTDLEHICALCGIVYVPILYPTLARRFRLTDLGRRSCAA